MADLRRSTRAAATNVKSMQEPDDNESSDSGDELDFGHKGGRTGRAARKASTHRTEAPGTSKRKPPPHPSTAKQAGKKQRIGDTPTNKGNATKSHTAPAPGLDGVTLLDVVKEKSAAIPSAVGRFVGHYERDPQAAIAELLTFLVQACGSNLSVPEEDPLDETDVDDVIKRLVASAEEGNVENLLFSKDKKTKHFRQNLLDFWDLLVLECQSNILFDEKLFDKCLSFVIAISCTAVRTFRQVGTLIGLQLVSSLVTVAKSFTDLRDTTQRQLQAEKKKKNAAGVADLTKTLEEMHSKSTATEELMRKLFTGVFMHRYRDVDEFIRANSVEALGSWILEYPSMFLKDLYTKYLGWMMNDKDAHVRQTAVIALRSLYEVEDNIASLELFTQRFCGRMLESAEDIDEDVAVEAVKLIKELLRHELLGDQDTSRLYELLVDESAQMRHVVGDLVHDQLVSQTLVAGSTPTGKSAKDGKTPEGQLKRVLGMLSEFSGNRALCGYVADALWDSTQVLQDWKTMTKALLTEKSKEELSEADATNLVRLLTASVKKVHGDSLVKETGGKPAHLTKAQREAKDSREEELTVVMLKALPALLRKYQADKAKVADLVEIAAYLNLELYSLKRQEPVFISTLQQVKDIFFKHSDADTLRACVRAIKYSVQEGKAELQAGAEQVLSELESEVVKRVKTAVKKAKKSGATSDDFALTVALARAQFLYAEQCPSDEGVDQSVLELLDEVDGLDDEVVRLALRLIFLQVAWALNALDKNSPSEEALNHVGQLRDRLIELVELAMDNALDQWSEESLQTKLPAEVGDILADTWTIFSHTKLKDTSLERLGYTPPDGQVRKYWELVEKRLDAAAEEIDEDEEQPTGEGDDCLKHEVVLPAAKILKWNLIPKDFLGPELVSNFVLHGKPTAEVIKSMTGRSEDQWRTYLEALKRAFKRFLEATTEDDDYASTPTFKDFKDLAHRISSVYASFAKAQLRPVILKIVKAGMEYAFSNVPRTLPFLEGALVLFAVKLEPADMRALIAEANKRAGDVNKEENPHAWRPFENFVEVLESKSGGNGGAKAGAAKGRKKSPDGRKLEFDEESGGEPSRAQSEPATPGDQTEQEEEDSQPLRDIRRERKSSDGAAAAAQYQRKSSTKKGRRPEDDSEEDKENVRKRREKGKAKEVPETQDEIEEDEPSRKSEEAEDDVLGSGEYGSYNATEEQLPAARRADRPQMKPLFGDEETEEEKPQSETPTQDRDAEDEELLNYNITGKRKAPTQASQSPAQGASASVGGSEEAEPIAYKRAKKT